MAILVLTKREPRETCSLCQRLDEQLADVPPGKLCASCLFTIRNRYSDVMREDELRDYQEGYRRTFPPRPKAVR